MCAHFPRLVSAYGRKPLGNEPNGEAVAFTRAHRKALDHGRYLFSAGKLGVPPRMLDEAQRRGGSTVTIRSGLRLKSMKRTQVGVTRT